MPVCCARSGHGASVSHPINLLSMNDMPPQQKPTRETKEHESDRRLGNIIIGVGLVLLVAIGWWLADAMYLARKADDCISSGRRNCSPVDVPVRER